MSAQFYEAVRQSIERFEAMERQARDAGWPEEAIDVRYLDDGYRRILSVDGVDVIEGGFRLHPGGIEVLSNVLGELPMPSK